jgi:hypothetical protein
MSTPVKFTTLLPNDVTLLMFDSLKYNDLIETIMSDSRYSGSGSAEKDRENRKNSGLEKYLTQRLLCDFKEYVDSYWYLVKYVNFALIKDADPLVVYKFYAFGWNICQEFAEENGDGTGPCALYEDIDELCSALDSFVHREKLSVSDIMSLLYPLVNLVEDEDEHDFKYGYLPVTGLEPEQEFEIRSALIDYAIIRKRYFMVKHLLPRGEKNTSQLRTLIKKLADSPYVEQIFLPFSLSARRQWIREADKGEDENDGSKTPTEEEQDEEEHEN